MFQYILKRLLLFIPTLFGVSLIIFFLHHAQLGDPVSAICKVEGNVECDEKGLIDVRKRLNLDLPLFYFTVNTQSYPDSFYKIPNYLPVNLTKKAQDRLLYESGNWQAVQAYAESVQYFYRKIKNIKPDSTNQETLSKLRQYFSPLLKEAEESEIRRLITFNKTFFKEDTIQNALYTDFQQIIFTYDFLKKERTIYKNYIPAVRWNGWNNQYHHWFSNYLHLDFGVSLDTGAPVLYEIKKRMPWTVLISVIAILLAYIIAIPLGVVAASKKGKSIDQTISTSLFALYSLPNFWIGILLITFFANVDFWYLFPPAGLTDTMHGSFTPTQKIMDYIHHLVLPIICWTYPALAFLSRQMRGGMLTTLEQDYIRTAKAKGVPKGKVIWKHAFRNALIPIITMLGNVLPRLIAGSVVLEVIFSIPGMGLYLFDAINMGNYPVVFAIVTILAVLTMIGYLLADILYVIIDPRVKFNR